MSTEESLPAKNLDIRLDAIYVLESLLWTPYIWGGDDFSGFDCSGLVVEVLKSVGWIAGGSDYTANMLLHEYSTYEVFAPYAGVLVLFINTGGTAVHIGMMRNKRQMIHAGGGGRATKTREDAIAHNAYIMPRDFKRYAAERHLRYHEKYKLLDPFLKEADYV